MGGKRLGKMFRFQDLETCPVKSVARNSKKHFLRDGCFW